MTPSPGAGTARLFGWTHPVARALLLACAAALASPQIPAAPPSETPVVEVESVTALNTTFPAERLVTLPKEARSFEIRYRSRTPAVTQFRYQLEPFDKDWQYSGTRLSAFYTNLPPGRYRFRVAGELAQGEWVEAADRFSIQIPPFIWETVWLRLACLGFVILAAAIAFRIYARSSRSLRERLTRIVEQQTAELRRQKERTEQQARELSLMAEDLTVTRDRALEATRAKSRFLAGMSHEIRTPMSGVIGLASLLLDTNLTAEQRSWVVGIRDSGQALLGIVNDILDFSRIEAGKLELSSESFDLFLLLEDIVGLMAPVAGNRGIEIGLCCSISAPLRFVGDPGRLRQVVLNLVGNAIKFTHNGYVLVSLETGPVRDGIEPVTISVRDTGIGISEDRVEAIFTEFNQADAATATAYGGTGLGLAISRRLTHLMGGVIEVESRLGAGSMFTVRLPLAVAEAYGGKSKPSEFLNSRVLIADTSYAGRTSLECLCLRLGMVPETVDSTAELVVACTTNKFRYALVDERLLKGSAIRELRKQTEAGSLTTVLLSPGPSSVCIAPLGCSLARPVRAADLVRSLSGSAGVAEPPLQVAEPASEQMFNDYHVLLVEDNKVNQTVGVRLLNKLGCQVKVANNGLEALAMVKASRFDLIFMDCRMPEMDGFEATARIRATEPRGERTPIVALTANATTADREACLRAGMDDFLSKPMTLVQLGQVLLRWLVSSGARTR